MAFALIPTSTVSNAGFSLVGGSAVHQCIDEGVNAADDGTSYVQSLNPGHTFEVGLDVPGFTPEVGAGHVLRVRARSASIGSEDAEFEIALYDGGVGGSLVYASGRVTVSADFADYEFDIGAASPLGDYSALTAFVTDTGSSTTRRIRITALEFAIPSEFQITGSIASTSATSASVTGAGRIVGATSASASLAAACTGFGVISGSSASTAQAAALLRGIGSIAGITAATSALSGTGMRVVFGTGSIETTSAASGSIAGLGRMVGAIVASSSASAIVGDGAEIGPFETISNTIRFRFHALVADPLSLMTVYDNDPTAQPDSASWCRLAVRMGQCEQIAIGPGSSNLYRKSGEVVASVYTPLGQGDGSALSIASAIVAGMRGVKVSETTFEAPRIETGYRDGRHWRVDVRMPFRADFELARATGAAPAALTLEDAASVVRTRFETEVETGLSIPIQYDGEDEATHAPDVTWCRLALVHGDSEAQERVGTAHLYRTVGIAYAYLFVPLARGDQTALRMADEIARDFRAVSDRGVTFRTPLVSGTQRAGAWWQVKVACPFHWDEIA